MLQLKALKAAETVKQFAAILDVKPAWLTYNLYVKSDADKYKTFDIPKKSGGSRLICAPQDGLKRLQRSLANVLQNCVEEINQAHGRGVSGVKMDRISHGFKRKRSIFTNAAWHRNRRYVFNADITDFFGSINFGRVRGFFISDKNFLLEPKVATLIAQIACFKNVLPQGSPCSPVISNLIGHVFDIHLARLSARVGCTYTRYADDLTFSTNHQSFPPEIAVCETGKTHTWVAGKHLSHIISMSGFSLNSKKSRMQYKASRQQVTGLVVNRHLNVRSEYRKTVRAMVTSLLRTGEFYFARHAMNTIGAKFVEKIPGRVKQLGGMLGFIDQVDHPRAHNVDAKNFEANKKPKKKTEIYRRFLIFDRFFRASRATLVCEGKTDNVYLTHAMRRLAVNYPQLTQIDKSGRIDLKVARFKYNGKRTNKVLGLNGGAGDLKNFIRLYWDEVSKHISAPGMQWPTIILFDNDDGAKPIYSLIKELKGQAQTSNESFIHIVKNLYAIPTPFIGDAKQSKIEDFFLPATKEFRLNGKKFNPENKYDDKTHYGKSDFAYKVIQPKANTINFSGFEPLLDRIAGVIDAHAKMITPHLNFAVAPDTPVLG